MSIRARIFVVFLFALLTGFGLLMYWVGNDVKNYYNESFEEILVDTSNMLAEMVALDLKAGGGKLENLQIAFSKSHLRKFTAQIYSVEKKYTDLHVYVTDKNGIVIFDSDDGKAVGQNYSKWRDVRLTLEGQYGARTSDMPVELGGDVNQIPTTIAYVGAPIYDNGTIIGMVSVGKPKTNIEKFVVNAKKKIMFAVLASIVFAMMLALLLYLWVSRPLQLLIDYITKVSRGERIPLPNFGGVEIQRVGEAIDFMRQSLEDKQYVEQYIQTLTHEIKSPLTAIKTSAELLEMELPADKRKQFGENIRRESERLNDFANRLLALAHLERCEILEKKEPVYVGDICSQIVTSLQSQANQKQISLLLEIDDNDVVRGDAFLLHQAIENLTRNALDFSPKGAVVRIAGKVEGDQWILEIVDQGEGIPDYAQHRIFERFYSLPRSSGQKSTGLGLNFVKEIAELHKGSIVLENMFPGVRARFTCPC